MRISSCGHWANSGNEWGYTLEEIFGSICNLMAHGTFSPGSTLSESTTDTLLTLMSTRRTPLWWPLLLNRTWGCTRARATAASRLIAYCCVTVAWASSSSGCMIETAAVKSRKETVWKRNFQRRPGIQMAYENHIGEQTEFKTFLKLELIKVSVND